MLKTDEIYNPYDFANPVDDDALFAGRSQELTDIRYYLRLAARAPRPINLVLTGPRSAGKTSLLNKIAHEATARQFCVARVDLNEGDASPLSLFYKIYDAVLVAAVSDGAFAGFTGNVYRNYRRQIDGPPDQALEPTELLFPGHFASASSGGRNLSEPTLKADLGHISIELGKPCVLLFDECDVLGQSRIELEMLRNVFMNTPGYMLVFAGTPNLFPVMEEVFSPIVRQFKKIPVERFTRLEETKACIEKPLRRLGVEPDEILRGGPVLHFEVHTLSAGRPYEIQLLCHFMFKRIEYGRARNMAITLDVLDDVRRELETQEGETDRPLISALRRLDRDELNLLRVLTEANATLNDLWFRSQLFDGTPVEISVLEDALTKFVDLGLLVVDETSGKVSFAGDQFDEVYTRYFAAGNDVTMFIASYDIETALDFALAQVLRGVPSAESLHFSRGSRSVDETAKLTEAINAFSAHLYEGSSLPDTVTEVYQAITRSRDSGLLELAELRLEVGEVTTRRWVTLIDPSEYTAESRLVDLATRAESVGGAFFSNIFSLPVPDREILVRRCIELGSPTQLKTFAEDHVTLGTELHNAAEYSDALEEFVTALAYDSGTHQVNGCAHVSLLLGEWEMAESFAILTRELTHDLIADDEEEFSQYAFGTYDLAVSVAMQGRYGEAAVLLNECKDVISSGLGELEGFLAIPLISNGEARTELKSHFPLIDAVKFLEAYVTERLPAS
jgi:hypothetical protein